MCGIVGVLGARRRDEGLATVAKMAHAILHRGPDDGGTWAIPDAAIGMRRLSIIDVAGGHQPMETPDGVIIVYNGEIYNYRQLRAELQEQGYKFRTTSDTEVVLNLYHSGGLDALLRLEGMYAICIVDNRSRELHLVRDRIGIKPLYFGTHHGKFYFASELKAIIQVLPGRPDIDDQSVFDYLTLRYVPSPRTIWKGFSKLLPSHRLTFDLNRRTFHVEKYGSVAFRAAPFDPNVDYDAAFRDHFLEAVRSHVAAADVPVGTLLSGGLDSSAVVAAARECGVGALHTFSIGFHGDGIFNETPYARAVAEHVGAVHHEVLIGPVQFVEFLPKFVECSDEPLADLASIPLHFVSELARKHVKVVLSGEGADEVLAGYGLDSIAIQADTRRPLLSKIPRAAFSLASHVAAGHPRDVLESMGKIGWGGYLRAAAMSPSWNWAGPDKERLWCGSPCKDTVEIVRSWYDSVESEEPLDVAQQVSCQDWLVEDLLMKADKMTMASSLELRVPFLADPFVAWATRLPICCRIGDRATGYVTKRILRRFAESRLPRAIIDRPKQGFPVPANHWLEGVLGEWASSSLAQHARRMSQWISPDVARQCLADARAGDAEAAHRTWSLLVFGEWCNRWL